MGSKASIFSSKSKPYTCMNNMHFIYRTVVDKIRGNGAGPKSDFAREVA